MDIIESNDIKYLLLGTVSVNTKTGYAELKQQWGADTILRQGDILYLCSNIIDVEFEDIEK